MSILYEENEKTRAATRGWMLILCTLIGVCVGFIAGFLLQPCITGNRMSSPPLTEELSTGNDELSDKDETTQTDDSLVISTPPITQETQPTSVKEPVVTDTVREGRFLTTMSRRHYGGRHEFWIYIYLENKDKISDPQNVPVGTILTIPDRAKYGIDPTSPESIEKAKKATRDYEERR